MGGAKGGYLFKRISTTESSEEEHENRMVRYLERVTIYFRGVRKDGKITSAKKGADGKVKRD